MATTAANTSKQTFYSPTRFERSMKQAQEGKVKRFNTINDMFQSLGI